MEKLELSGVNKDVFLEILNLYADESCQESALRKEAILSIEKVKQIDPVEQVVQIVN